MLRRSSVDQALAFAATFIATALGGCTEPAGDTGRVSVAVTATPVDDFAAVVLSVSFVEVHRVGTAADDWARVSRDLAVVDLNAYIEGVRSSMGSTSVATGSYDALRLTIDRAHGVWPNATEEEFAVQDRQLVIGERWEVVQEGTTALTVHFDVPASVIEVSGAYEFRPAVSMILEGGGETRTVGGPRIR